MNSSELLVLSLVKHIQFLADIGCADRKEIGRLCRMAEAALVGEPLRPAEIDRMVEEV